MMKGKQRGQSTVFEGFPLRQLHLTPWQAASHFVFFSSVGLITRQVEFKSAMSKLPASACLVQVTTTQLKISTCYAACSEPYSKTHAAVMGTVPQAV